MKSTFSAQLAHLPYFTSVGVSQLLKISEQSAKVALSRCAAKGTVVRLKNGYYVTDLFVKNHSRDLGFLETISAILDPFPYVSTEFVLQQHGVLTEATFTISAVTEKNTHVIENKLGSFVYRHINPKLFAGFAATNLFGVSYRAASKSKALFDYFYFRPMPIFSKHSSIAEEWRLNIQDWSIEAQQEFSDYVILSRSPKMQQIARHLEREVWHQ